MASSHLASRAHQVQSCTCLRGMRRGGIPTTVGSGSMRSISGNTLVGIGPCERATRVCDMCGARGEPLIHGVLRGPMLRRVAVMLCRECWRYPPPCLRGMDRAHDERGPRGR
jgi:hypothetical protein